MSVRVLQFVGIGLSAAVLIVCLTLLTRQFLGTGQEAGIGPAQSDVVGGPFTLVSEAGETVTEETFAGRYMLMYFGFTFCPDVCPTDLAIVSRAYSLLPDDIRAQVQPIFVTVDPFRDDQRAVEVYTALFHQDLLGLTGTDEQVDAAKSAYRVWAEPVGKEEDPEFYLVNHTAFTYLQGPDNENVFVFSHDTPPEEMARHIEAAIAG